MSEGRLQGGGCGRAYRGPDRRSRSADLLSRLPASKVLPMACMVAAGAGVPAFFLLTDGPTATTVESYLAVAAGLLCVVAGGTWLVAWRVMGRALQGWLGPAFVVLGLTTLLSDGLSGLGVGISSAVQPVDDFVVAVVAALLIVRGLTATEVDAGLSPLVTLAASAGAGVLVLGLMNIAGSVGALPGWAVGTPAVAAFHAAAAAAWCLVAIVGARSAGSKDVSAWILVVAVLLALGFAARILQPVTPVAPVVAASLIFTGASLALGTSIVRLQEVLRVDDRRELRIHRALDATRRQAVTDRESLEDWLHDLRNAVAGLQAADTVLRSRSDWGLSDRDELADAVTAELARLHALIEPPRAVRLAALDVHALLRPLVAAERARGSAVELRAEGEVSVLADADALGRVVQNLLENARRHAPGTPVVVAARRRLDGVEITVRDGGSGIPRDDEDRVFARGVRGAEGSGSGLGLFVARSLVTAMGGRIGVDADGRSGCCIKVTLPVAVLPRTAPLVMPRSRFDAAPVGSAPRAI